jgi:metallophosphoesterase (TIGR00282 family)
MSVKIIALGDVVGRPGRSAVRRRLPELRREHNPAFVAVNGENSAAGSGLTCDIVEELLGAGIDCLTGGDHVFRKREVLQLIDREPRLLRPFNWSPKAAGSGYAVYEAADGLRVGVVNLIGRVFLGPADCPFRAADEAIAALKKAGAQIILVDFHAEATSEKVAMGWHLDGRVCAVWGTHTHIQTADERVLPGGTAYITDLGMSGPYDSVIGRDKGAVLHTMLTQMPQRFEVAKGDVRVCGVLIEADPRTGKALAIERLQLSEEQTS